MSQLKLWALRVVGASFFVAAFTMYCLYNFMDFVTPGYWIFIGPIGWLITALIATPGLMIFAYLKAHRND